MPMASPAGDIFHLWRLPWQFCGRLKPFYPERFEDIDMKTVTRDFYKQSFDWDLDDATTDKILSGQDMRGSKNQPDQ
jgi:hypothetical protein